MRLSGGLARHSACLRQEDVRIAENALADGDALSALFGFDFDLFA